MFWQRKKKTTNKKARRGLTGSGEFISNIDFWLWDDAASPGLITIDRLHEMRAVALNTDEHARVSKELLRDSIVDLHGRKLGGGSRIYERRFAEGWELSASNSPE